MLVPRDLLEVLAVARGATTSTASEARHHRERWRCEPPANCQSPTSSDLDVAEIGRHFHLHRGRERRLETFADQLLKM